MNGYRTVRYRLWPGSRARVMKLLDTAGACCSVWKHFVYWLNEEYSRVGVCDYHYHAVESAT